MDDRSWVKTTAPLGDDKPQTTFFWWKFVNDLSFPETMYRSWSAERPWYVIKAELEQRYHFDAKQKKRKLTGSAFLAYPESEWIKVTNRHALFEPDPPALPLSAFDHIHTDDKLIIARFPSYLTSRVYKEVNTLTFDETKTEEERLDAITKFDGTRPTFTPNVAVDHAPPPGYRCHNCGSQDHWKHMCDAATKLRAPKGIPKMFLQKMSEEDANEDNESGQETFVMDDGTRVKKKTMHTNKIFL